jgi:hypothetical protein
MRLSLINVSGLSSSVYFAHIEWYWNSSSFTIYKSSLSTGFAKQIMLILRILCYNGNLNTWTVVSLTTAKFKPLIFLNQSQSQGDFKTGGLPPISSSWRQATIDSRQGIFFQLNPWGHSPYVTSSLMREWMCRFQFLLVLASAVILWSESRGTRDHILLFRFETPPTWRARSLYFYPPGTRWPSYTSGH